MKSRAATPLADTVRLTDPASPPISGAMLPAQKRFFMKVQKENQQAMAQREVYKTFGGDTEAGRLLQKLYKGLEKANGVKYPKVKTMASSDERPKFLPAGGKVDKTEHRGKEKIESNIVVPKFGKPKGVSSGSLRE